MDHQKRNLKPDRMGETKKSVTNVFKKNEKEMAVRVLRKNSGAFFLSKPPANERTYA